MNHSNQSVNKHSSKQDTLPTTLEIGQIRRFNESLLRFLPIGVVIIDRNYCILTANSAAHRLLGLHNMRLDQDFLHAIRGIPYHKTRLAIDTVFRERSSIVLPEVELEVSTGGSGHIVSLSIALMQSGPGLPDLVTICVSDINEQVRIRQQLEHAQEKRAQLMHELWRANKRLSDTNKELMDANTKLQVFNEELILTHEELQASIEEFATIHEELQATREELESNNEELQATREELATTNEELRARTSSLQELAVIVKT
jgi:two-component system, chemotaxis family, CheB/CheR fusion protein